jgi:hypothetical protein
MNLRKSKIALVLMTSIGCSSAFAIEVDYWVNNQSDYPVTLQLKLFYTGTLSPYCWVPDIDGKIFNEWAQNNPFDVVLKGHDKIKLGKINYSWSCWSTLYTELRFKVLSQFNNDHKERQCAFNLEVKTKGHAAQGYVEKADLKHWNTNGCDVDISQLSNHRKVELNLPAVFKKMTDIKPLPQCKNEQEVRIGEDLDMVAINPICKGGKATIRIPKGAFNNLSFDFKKPDYRTSEAAHYAVTTSGLKNAKGQVSGVCKYANPSDPACFPSLMQDVHKPVFAGANGASLSISNTGDSDLLPIFNINY